MRAQQIKALPVVDAQRLVVGIVTVADFMWLANLDIHEGLGQRLRTLVMGRTGQPQNVGEIMSHPVQVAHVGQHAMDLVPLFFQGGHHHIPIVESEGRLVGVVTQTDLVRTLAAAVQGRDEAGVCGRHLGAQACTDRRASCPIGKTRYIAVQLTGFAQCLCLSIEAVSPGPLPDLRPGCSDSHRPQCTVCRAPTTP